MGCKPSSNINPLCKFSNKNVTIDLKTKNSLQEKLCRHYHPPYHIQELYDFDANNSMIGKGAFGIVQLAVKAITKECYAVKSIQKDEKSVLDFRKEISLWQQARHPSLVRLIEVFEENEDVHMVMELCEGGNLLEALKKRGEGFPEDIVRHMMRQLISAIHYLHGKRICHRDIKCENILFESKDTNNFDIKLCDFGGCERFPDNKKLTEPLGTLAYMAPEVIEGEYDEKCDIWSLGVVMYMLLSNRAPFHGNNEDKLEDSILEGQYVTVGPVWDKVSESCKRFLERLLRMKHEERYSAEQALRHPWLKKPGPTFPIEHMGKQMMNFLSYPVLKRTCLHIIAFHAKVSLVSIARNTFYFINSSLTGLITFEEFSLAFSSVLSRDEIDQVFAACEVDGSRSLSYINFLAASLTPDIFSKDANVRMSFEHIDQTGKGSISPEDLRELYGNDVDGHDVTRIIQAVDKNGLVRYDEFVKMMKDNIIQVEKSEELVLTILNPSATD